MAANADTVQAAAMQALKAALLDEAGLNKKEIFDRLEKIEARLEDYFDELEATRKTLHMLAKELKGDQRTKI